MCLLLFILFLYSANDSSSVASCSKLSTEAASERMGCAAFPFDRYSYLYQKQSKIFFRGHGVAKGGFNQIQESFQIDSPAWNKITGVERYDKIKTILDSTGEKGLGLAIFNSKNDFATSDKERLGLSASEEIIQAVGYGAHHDGKNLGVITRISKVPSNTPILGLGAYHQNLKYEVAFLDEPKGIVAHYLYRPFTSGVPDDYLFYKINDLAALDLFLKDIELDAWFLKKADLEKLLKNATLTEDPLMRLQFNIETLYDSLGKKMNGLAEYAKVLDSEGLGMVQKIKRIKKYTVLFDIQRKYLKQISELATQINPSEKPIFYRLINRCQFEVGAIRNQFPVWFINGTKAGRSLIEIETRLAAIGAGSL